MKSSQKSAFLISLSLDMLVASCVCPQAEVKLLTEAVQEAGPIITKAKGGRGAATLSMAFAAARFALTLVKGLNGAHAVIECAYVRSDIVTDVR